MENPTDDNLEMIDQDNCIEKPKQKRQYIKTPAREKAIENLIKGRKEVALKINTKKQLDKIEEKKKKLKEEEEKVLEVIPEEIIKSVKEPVKKTPKKRTPKKPVIVMETDDESSESEEEYIIKKVRKSKPTVEKKKESCVNVTEPVYLYEEPQSNYTWL
jgi:hypothetical protein